MRLFRPARRTANRIEFRPAVRLLEDRNVPSHVGAGYASPGPATHLVVLTPENVVAGREFGILVEAEDASNHIATGYTGTVGFSLAPPDANAVLPGNFTF